MQDISQKAKSGAAWLTLSQVLRPGWEFFVGVILARILSPKEFGIVAIGMIFFGLAAMLSSFGISSAIIQKDKLQNIHIRTAQTIATLFGVAMCIITIVASRLVSSFFKEPLAGLVLSYFSINFVTSSFGMIPTALMTKKVEFKKIAIIEILASIVYGISALVMAKLNFGVWSLVYSPVISVTFGSVITCFATNYLPKLGWDKAAAGEIIRFGGTLTTSSILNYTARNVDYLIIGKFLGATPLGLYKRAYDLAVLPKEKIVDSIGRVFFPSLCEIKDNKGWAKSAYLKTIKLISFISFPVLLGFILTAPELIKVVYGDKWSGAVKALQIMAWGGIFYCLLATSGSILLAYGKIKKYFYVQLIYAILLLLFTLFGVQFGIEGVAFGVSLALFVFWLINFTLCNQIIGLSIYEYFLVLKPILIVNGFLFVCVVLSDYLLANTQDAVKLIVKFLCGSMIYLGYFAISKDDMIKELRIMVLSRTMFLRKLQPFFIKKQ